MKICFNNEIVNAKDKIFNTKNRALKYGDGFFESIRLIQGKAPFLDLHFQRLISNLKLLDFEIPNYFSVTHFEELLKKLAHENCIESGGRARINIFRVGDGNYVSQSSHLNFIIEMQPLNDSQFKLNEKGLRLGVYRENLKSVSSLGNVKSNSSLLFVLAGLWSKNHGFDDALILNTQNRICEATASNLFVFRENELLTPALSEGCVDGVMRKIITKISEKTACRTQETQIELEELESAEEVILTNAVQGLKWVEHFGGTTFRNSKSKQLIALLNEKATKVVSSKLY